VAREKSSFNIRDSSKTVADENGRRNVRAAIAKSSRKCDDIAGAQKTP